MSVGKDREVSIEKMFKRPPCSSFNSVNSAYSVKSMYSVRQSGGYSV